MAAGRRLMTDRYFDATLLPGESDLAESGEFEKAAMEIFAAVEESDFPNYSLYTGVLAVPYLRVCMWQCGVLSDGSSGGGRGSGGGEGEGEDEGSKGGRGAVLRKALDEVEGVVLSWKKSKHARRISFLNGRSGCFALQVWILSQMREGDGIGDLGSREQEAVRELLRVSQHEESEDELLYGKAGALYALLFAYTYCTVTRSRSALEEAIRLRAAQLVDKGRRHGSELLTLSWEWHDKCYLGAAHGVAGICAILCQCPLSDKDARDVHATLLQLATLRYGQDEGEGEGGGGRGEGGGRKVALNTKSSINSESDRLVQWCHGAPGSGMAFLVGYHRFRDKTLLQAAVECATVTMDRGLLRKLPLCHGIAGNLFLFLQLHHTLKVAEPESALLYSTEAKKFATFLLQYKHFLRDGVVPYGDSAASLFEGLAGVALAFLAVAHPEHAAFPSIEIPPRTITHAKKARKKMK